MKWNQKADPPINRKTISIDHNQPQQPHKKSLARGGTKHSISQMIPLKINFIMTKSTTEAEIKCKTFSKNPYWGFGGFIAFFVIGIGLRLQRR